MSVLRHLLVGAAADPAAGRVSPPVERRNHSVRHLGLAADPDRVTAGRRPADSAFAD